LFSLILEGGMTKYLAAFAIFALGISCAQASEAGIRVLLAKLEVRPPIFTPIPRDTLEEARSGCCSHHGGVAGCDTATGHQQCRDGSDSPSCGCGE
jgi:hypothetical protein